MFEHNANADAARAERLRTPGSDRALAAALAVIIAGIAVTAGPTRAAPGDIFNLGTLGGPSSSGWGVNNAGQISGEASFVGPFGPEDHAFRYEGLPGAGGMMVDLGLGSGLGESHGLDINAAGQVAGWAAFLVGSEYQYQACRYDGTPGSGGVMRGLGTLAGGLFSFGTALNASGQVTGYSDVPDGDRAFRYDGTPGSGGVMRSLGTLGGLYSYGVGINDAGQVVGQSYISGNTYWRAFRYDGTPGSGGIMRNLGTLGGTVSEAFDINNSGQVVGAAQITGDAFNRAFRYTGTPGAGGTMIDLGTLGGNFSRAFGINDAGFVVGDAQRLGLPWDYAALWLNDVANTSVDLNAWLASVNPAMAALWDLENARDINDFGLITGWGHYYDGPGGLSDGARAYLLDASSFVPEPAGLSVLAPALAAVCGRRARGRRSRDCARWSTENQHQKAPTGAASHVRTWPRRVLALSERRQS